MADNGDRFDPADYLRTKASIDAFLKGAALENDSAYLSYARTCAIRAAARWNIPLAPPDLRPTVVVSPGKAAERR